MFKIILFFFSINISLLAYIDSDIDGVPDESDKCANTPLTELVDLSGCTIKKLKSDYHFDIVLGQSYADDGDSTLYSSSLKVNYYYKKFSMQLASSYYNSSIASTNNRGQNDTYLNLYYLFNPVDDFYLTLGGGLIFPTYDNEDNKLDYTTSLYGRYKLDRWSFILGVAYNDIGDIDSTNSLDYENIFSYNTGLGYSWNSTFYSSINYYRSESIFTNVEDLETLSVDTYYAIDEHWFSSLNYGYCFLETGKRESIGVNLGYYW
ncbi:hypothetical protein MNB_SV-12-1901 [hydrothermal vent metagenome]|uniref:DUF3187 domain-containing protein n=1 Tax=hydrothermal vent metagenome TaxID=652676 RepID=A0A1W1BKE4_9ZZZZ